MGRKLSDAALMGEMLAMFGVAHTATLVGWATLAVVWNAQDGDAFIEMPVGGRSTRYKRLNDFRRMGEHLRAKGYELDDSAQVRVPATLLDGITVRRPAR